MNQLYSGLWARLRAFVYLYFPAVAGPAPWALAPVRVLALLVALLASVAPAWAQAPAFTTTRTTGTAYTSINATGTSFTFNNTTANLITDDNTSTAVTLPAGFDFTYLGAPVTGFVACLNGWISLDPTVTTTTNDNNMGNGQVPRQLALLWEDLVCQGDNVTLASLANSMKYQISGTAPNRVLTVEWIGMEVWQNDGPNLNFQVKLFETTNVIQYQYGLMSGFDGRRDYTYTYSLGLTGTTAAVYLAQQVQNSNFFAQANPTAANRLAIVPASYSQIQFTPSASLVSGTNPAAVAPTNNEPAGAITLPVGSFSPTSFATTYSSANATASAGIATCAATAPGTPDDDVWFKFTTTSTQNITVTLRSSGGYDGVLQVFSDAGTTAVACVNANGNGLAENYNNNTLPAGTYYVRAYHAGASSGTTGQFAVAVYTQPPVPANNECATAIALTAGTACTPMTGTSLGATTSGNPATCNGTPDDDVWYSFTTAAIAHPYTLTLDSGVDFDGVVQVLSGTCGSFASIACVNSTLDGGIETVPLNSLAPNTAYYVRVYHAAAGSGSGDFTLCLVDTSPRITSFTPTSGPVGTSVILTGENLSSATSVRFNGATQATITANTATSLTVAVPAGATTGTLTVTTPTGTSDASAQTFTVIPPPTLTAVAPTPGGLGQSITLTGTNLTSPTALTINGANAFANIISNTATSVVVRVPATATASGNVSLTTGGGTATLAFAVMAPPGNTLAFDGVDDYLSFGSTPAAANLGPVGFTLEAWVYFDGNTGVNSILRKTGDYNLYLNGGKLSAEVWPVGGGNASWRILNGAVLLPANRWTHVAATWNPTGTAFLLYVNGVLDAGASGSTGSIGGSEPLNVGRSSLYNQYFKGRLDEVRIYSTALTAAQLQADMTSTTAAVPASLGLYYNMDQGTPATASTGANAGLTTLYDLGPNATPGTLTNFALASGNTTSNYVESYAMVVPTATAATARTATGFTANWTAPAVGMVNNGYRLDVSTVATFATVITGSPFTVNSGTSQVVTGLAANTTYYYRVRADKTSVTGQGATSNVVTVCPAPVAIPQNVTLVLDASGNATLAATATSNGSTANCGPAAANTLTVQKVVTGLAFGEVAEGGTLTLTAPAGGKFVSVEFASYGTPTGTNGTYAASGCDASTSLAVVRAALLGNNSGSIGANNNVFGDPCNGTPKKLAVRATYTVPVAGATPATQLTYSCADLGANTVELTVTDAGNNTSTALATVTVADNTAPATGPLPAAPTAALSNVPEAKNYGVLYQLDIQNAASFNNLAAVPYTVNNSGAAVAQPARVAYYMELTSGGVSKWVWASMDNFASTLTQLGVPHPRINPVNWDQSVTNLNVFASANAGLATGTTVGTGRLEMWRFNYGPENVRGLANASATTYDFSDRNDNANNYGSFQVHNLTAGQTLLAYNNWGGGGSGGGIGDLGIGNQVGGSGNPDWTFAYNTSTYTVKRLYILVPNVAPFTQTVTVALDVNGTATVTGSQVTTAAAADNCGVASITVSPNTFTCAQVGTPQTVTVTLTDASGNSSRSTATVNVTAPITPTTTWNGNVSTDWSDCANWSYGKVPDAATNVIIPSGLALYPVLNTGTVAMKNLTIHNNFTLGSAATLQVNGNFSFNGTTTLGGTVALVGAGTQGLGGTSSASSFPNLVINKTAGTVELQRNLPLNGTLTFTAGAANVGVLNTNAYRINLFASATLTETETSYVVGKVAASRTLAAGTAQPFGGIGLTLTPTAGSTAPGLTPVVRTTGTALTGVGTSVSVLRSFDIQPANRTGLNVNMVFSYFEHELNSIPEANLVLFKSETGAADTWGSQRPATLNPTANTMTKTGITSFSIWTLGDAARPLPVELTAFTATAEGHSAVRLHWTTASEKNSAYFVVERSLDAASFHEVGTMPAAGNSSSPRTYQLLDTRLPAGAALLYYRLRQVDTDGTLAYSPVQAVKLANAKSELMLAPNPTHGRATLTGAVAGASVQVYDAVGRLVCTATAEATGTAVLALPAGQPTGVYVVRTGTQALRLVLE